MVLCVLCVLFVVNLSRVLFAVCGDVCGGYLWGISDICGGEERGGRTRPRRKGRREDTEGPVKLQRVVGGGISRVVTVVCGGERVREKHEVRDGARREGGRRHEVCVVRFGSRDYF